MDERKFHIFVTFVIFIVLSESSVIVPRDTSKEGSGDEDIPSDAWNPSEKDKKLGWNPGVSFPAVEDDFGIYEFDRGVNNPQGRPLDPQDRDYEMEADKRIPGARPGKFPSNSDRGERPKYGDRENENEVHENVDKEHDLDKPADEDGIDEPFDVEEDFDKSVDDDRDSELPVHEDGLMPKDEDDQSRRDEEKSKDDESHRDEEKGKEDESHRDDEKGEDDEFHRDEKDGEDDDSHRDEDKVKDDEPHHDEEVGEDDESHRDEDDDEKVDEGSIFDTPFFNLKQVQKYFQQLERALGHVFRETLDEALLLNGTLANTTEEEVDINGKKFTVLKSIIKSADNDGSIYVETLSSKPKQNETEEIMNTEIKNATEKH